MATPRLETWDLVVVGTGIAGLTTALSAAPLKTLVVTKTAQLASGSSNWAQGGIAFPVDENDLEGHINDTLVSGAGACNEANVRAMIGSALEARAWLEGQGVVFDRSDEGHYRLGKEGAHSRRRIFHVRGDSTGQEMVKALMARAQAAAHIILRTGQFCQALHQDPTGRVTGVSLLGLDGQVTEVSAGAVVMAGGGMGQLFGRTTNPPESTGDVLALAQSVGAVLADLEMVQFHPTGLDISRKAPSAVQYPLLSEALRGEGATLGFENGVPLPVNHPMGFLGPRDVVARAIFQALQLGRPVFLDARKINAGHFTERFPTVSALCAKYGFDPAAQVLPVTPVVHYSMGGVQTDSVGRTAAPGLYVVGESACTGIHGANRLASNSLLECVVFGRRAALDILAQPRAVSAPVPATPAARPADNPFAGFDLPALRQYRLALQKILFAAAGPVRDASGLEHGLEALEELKEDVDILRRRLPPAAGPASAAVQIYARENGHLFRLAPLVLQAALDNQKSIGAHYRRDFPSP